MLGRLQDDGTVEYPAASRIVYSDGNPPPASKGTQCTEEEGMTRQSDKDAADINLVIKKYNLQPEAMVPGWSGRGEYRDVSAFPSYVEALKMINSARETFMKLPPEVRAYWGNDPAVMLDRWQSGQDMDVFLEIGWLEQSPSEEAKAKEAREARVAEWAEGVRRGMAPAKAAEKPPE